MQPEPGEEFLRRETMHPAVFVYPALGFLPLLVAGLPDLLLLGVVAPLGGGVLLRGLLGVVLIFTVLVVGTAFVLTVLAYRNAEVLLTNKRLMYRTGILFRAAGELPLENVEGIHIFESLPGRMFGYGAVIVTTLGGAQFPIRFVRRPQILHMLVQKAVGKAKESLRTPKSTPAAQDDSRYMPGAPASRASTPRIPVPPDAEPIAPFPTREKDSSFPLFMIGAGVVFVTLIILAVVLIYPSVRAARSAVASISDLANPKPFPSQPGFALQPPVQPPRPPASLEQIKVSAEEGDPEAQDKLADTLRMTDVAQAVVWYRKAAVQGVPNSEYQLAHILVGWATSPIATPKNAAAHADEGVPWLVRAAEHGVPMAQVELAQLYMEGRLINKDLPEAYKWLSLQTDGSQLDFAANLARTYRQGLLLKMSTSEIAEGRRRLALFASHPEQGSAIPEPAFIQRILLNGISGIPPRALAIINGKTVAAGETVTLKVDARVVNIQCLAVSASGATIQIEGVGARELRLK